MGKCSKSGGEGDNFEKKIQIPSLNKSMLKVSTKSDYRKVFKIRGEGELEKKKMQTTKMTLKNESM